MPTRGNCTCASNARSFRDYPKRAFAFLIRTYLTPVPELSADERECLAGAVENMPPEARRYKGLARDAVVISRWLRSL